MDMEKQDDAARSGLYLIESGGMWYRQDETSVTGVKAEAGRFTLDDIAAIHFPGSMGLIATPEGEAPEFSRKCWPETKLKVREREKAELEKALRAALAGIDVMNAALKSPIHRLLPAVIARAKKAAKKHPQPNYTISKWAEETGEAHKEMIHAAEGRGDFAKVIDEVVDALAMLHRLMVEGDEVHGLEPLGPHASRWAGENGLIMVDHPGREGVLRVGDAGEFHELTFRDMPVTVGAGGVSSGDPDPGAGGGDGGHDAPAGAGGGPGGIEGSGGQHGISICSGCAYQRGQNVAGVPFCHHPLAYHGGGSRAFDTIAFMRGNDRPCGRDARLYVAKAYAGQGTTAERMAKDG